MIFKASFSFSFYGFPSHFHGNSFLDWCKRAASGLVELSSGSSGGGQACLLECKTKAPFYQDANKLRHCTCKTQPDASVSAMHRSQVKIQLLVTGKADAYLVSWACSSATKSKITINFEWLQAALELLSNIKAIFEQERGAIRVILQGQVSS